MDLGGGARNIARAAAVVACIGLALTIYAVLADDLTYVTGGSCITLTALVVLALLLIRTWIVDTQDVRTALSASQREAERERGRYIALQAALENEQGRLNRDMAAARQQMARDLIKEREALGAEFEEKRDTLISETMEATVLMFRNGHFAPDTSPSGQLIHFPRQEQQHAQATERTRSREHGVVGP